MTSVMVKVLITICRCWPLVDLRVVLPRSTACLIVDSQSLVLFSNLGFGLVILKRFLLLELITTID
jgi:hypothetical protein